jgi:hypothetical protein
MLIKALVLHASISGPICALRVACNGDICFNWGRISGVGSGSGRQRVEGV